MKIYFNEEINFFFVIMPLKYKCKEIIYGKIEQK